MDSRACRSHLREMRLTADWAFRISKRTISVRKIYCGKDSVYSGNDDVMTLCPMAFVPLKYPSISA